ncbi:cation diffusion facilitator family transporter [Azospirillum sp. sgz301742]
MAAHLGNRKVIYAALAGNLLVALTKFATAIYTGSSAMLSEGVHSLVDTGNQGLLLYGMRRAAQPPDDAYPLGHGRELYFWSFIVALLVFALGAGVSMYEGISHIRNPVHITNPLANYIVLGLAMLFEGASWRVAYKALRAVKGSRGWFQTVRESKDPTTFTVLFEDSAALLGLFIALLGTVGAEILGNPMLDGAASIAIGLVLAVTATLLARETKGLLMGEAARPELRRALEAIAASHPGVDHARTQLTVHLAPHQVVGIVGVDFSDTLTSSQVESAAEAIERRVREAHPEMVMVIVRPSYGTRFVPEVVETKAEGIFARTCSVERARENDPSRRPGGDV